MTCALPSPAHAHGPGAHPEPIASGAAAPAQARATTPAAPLPRVTTEPVGGALLTLTTDVSPTDRAWLLEHLDAFRSALHVLVRAATGVDAPERPLEVVVFADRARYEEHAAHHAPKLAHNGGYYDGAARVVVSYFRANPLQLHFHELAHAVLGDVFDDPGYTRYARPRWPVWFDEGLAEYVSTFDMTASGEPRFGVPHPARLAVLADAAARGRMPTVDAILLADATRFRGPDSDLWYAASWALADLLLTAPDLRAGVPRWVARLRAGEDGFASFVATFGDGFRALDTRLASRLGEHLRDSPTARSLDDGGLATWTRHEGGDWHVDATAALVGVAAGAGQTATITRPVGPMRALAIDLEVQRTVGSVGLVLGHHGLGAYPYHTLVDLEGDRVTVRHSETSDAVRVVGRRPAATPAGRWVPVRLVMAHGVLSLWVDGRHALSVPSGGETVSLVGLHVRGGGARFRHVALSSPGRAQAGSLEGPSAPTADAARDLPGGPPGERSPPADGFPRPGAIE